MRLGQGTGRFVGVGAVALALALAACSSLVPGERSNVLSDVTGESPSDSGNKRILADHGGRYNDPRLEALLNRTVDRLVAASERPDLKYKVTVLNSSAINAFALSSGQLYVTRGLLALANDTSELASVMS